MAINLFQFDGANWEAPDIRDSRYWEALSECLKSKYAYANVTLSNSYPPQSDNPGLFLKNIISSFNSNVVYIIPSFYDIRGYTHTWLGLNQFYEINLDDPKYPKYKQTSEYEYQGMFGGQSYPGSGQGFMPNSNNEIIAWVLAGAEPNISIHAYTNQPPKWTVQTISDLVGITDEWSAPVNNVTDATQTYGMDNEFVQRWMIAMYKVLSLLKVYYYPQLDFNANILVPDLKITGCGTEICNGLYKASLNSERWSYSNGTCQLVYNSNGTYGVAGWYLRGPNMYYQYSINTVNLYYNSSSNIGYPPTTGWTATQYSTLPGPTFEYITPTVHHSRRQGNTRGYVGGWDCTAGPSSPTGWEPYPPAWSDWEYGYEYGGPDFYATDCTGKTWSTELQQLGTCAIWSEWEPWYCMYYNYETSEYTDNCSDPVFDDYLTWNHWGGGESEMEEYYIDNGVFYASMQRWRYCIEHDIQPADPTPWQTAIDVVCEADGWRSTDLVFSRVAQTNQGYVHWDEGRPTCPPESYYQPELCPCIQVNRDNGGGSSLIGQNTAYSCIQNATRGLNVYINLHPVEADVPMQFNTVTGVGETDIICSFTSTVMPVFTPVTQTNGFADAPPNVKYSSANGGCKPINYYPRDYPYAMYAGYAVYFGLIYYFDVSAIEPIIGEVEYFTDGYEPET